MRAKVKAIAATAAIFAWMGLSAAFPVFFVVSTGGFLLYMAYLLFLEAFE